MPLERFSFAFLNPNHAAAVLCALLPLCWGWRGLSGSGHAEAARVHRVPDHQDVADEAARRPASKPLSVSPCLRVLRVDRPEGAVVQKRAPPLGPGTNVL